ncbi:MAG: hypothetical protein KDE22_02615 [Rhodobacterales bacterium]|nr:hypothetical protein [Rhodobacterales bacterium]
MARPFRLGVLCLALAGWVSVVHAQAPGQTRANLRPVEDAPAGPAGPAEPLLDTREAMRGLIERISRYAKGLKPDFIVAVQGGREILTKSDEEAADNPPPAKAYLKSIDAILLDGLRFGPRELDEEPPEARTEALMKAAAIAKNAGLTVLTLDYAKETKHILEALRANFKDGFVPFVGQAQPANLSRIPRVPYRPFREDAHSVISMKDVKNYLYLRETQGFGREDEFALKLHATNFDLVIVDVFHGRKPLSKRAVDTLRYKQTGSRRLVLAYVDIGSAASYHYYWQDGWREGAPAWIGAPHPRDPDRYYVEFWRPEWQAILFGTPTSYIYGTFAQGYDGVLLGGLDSLRFAEGGMEAVSTRR